MATTFTRAEAGRPLEIHAEAYNASLDAAEAYARDGRRVFEGGVSGVNGLHNLTVDVRNSSGSNINAFETFCVDHNQTGQPGHLTITSNEYSVGRAPLLNIGQANREDGPVHLVVTLEPIKNGEIGKAVIRGLCIAKVDFVDASHTYADLPQTGSILQSGYGGRVRIIQREVTGGDSDHCLVDLLQSAVGSQMVYISAGPTSGLYTGFYYQQNTNSPYNQFTTTVEVRAVPIGGGTLQVGRIYFGTTLGTVTVSGTPYDLVSLVGDANFTATTSGDESAWTGGLINTTTQSFRGNKYFRNSIYSQDTAIYGTAYSQMSTNGAIFCTSGDYLGSTYNTITLTTSGSPAGIQIVYHDGTYTNTASVGFYTAGSASDDFICITSENQQSGYKAALTHERWGVIQSSTVSLGADASFSIIERDAGGASVGTHSFVFKGGLLTSYTFV